MTSCCDKKSCDLEKLSRDQSRVLWLVLAINAVMFFVELGAGILAGSVALTSDSLDMLGDAIAYGSSLYVVRMGTAAKARSAMLKGSIILVSAVAVLGGAVYRSVFQAVPDAPLMGWIGGLALAANAVCLYSLTRHRNDDVNMQSVWLCSRNDIIANTSVLGAAALVAYTASPWPDLIVGVALALLFTRSAFQIFGAARREQLAVAAAVGIVLVSSLACLTHPHDLAHTDHGSDQAGHEEPADEGHTCLVGDGSGLAVPGPAPAAPSCPTPVDAETPHFLPEIFALAGKRRPAGDVWRPPGDVPLLRTVILQV